ncbi:MAG: tRNA uridine-5-carboxymethylaminomethyl(34) synthesis GTPase MnmE [Aestuariivirga sp.]
MTSGDTIYAVSSGAGKAGIAVIRVSGGGAAEAITGMTGSLPGPRRAVLATIRNPGTGEVLDRGIVLWLPGPQSVTGEDVAEFHVHGSAAVISGVFAAFGRYGNMRPAEPGEFTRRAFANGRMDLVEAEGLADLLSARTPKQRQQAIYHLMGAASSIYEDWRLKLLGILARVEAAVDFADEEGVAETALANVRGDIALLAGEMAAALDSVDRAAAIRQGIKVVLAGLPNTGKSSLLNALARREAAIVSSRPGTTRDVIEVEVEIEGLAVVLTDTAGLREHSPDEIETIGIARTRRELDGADLVVWVSSPDVEGSDMPWSGVEPALRVLNKMDLIEAGSGLFNMGAIAISAQSGAGVPEMLAELGRLVRAKYGQAEHGAIVRDRQKHAVAESIRYLNESMSHDASQLELAAEDLRKAAHSLARITGRIDVEDLLSAIFSEFCIGK